MATKHPSTVKKCAHCGNEFVGFSNSKYCKGGKCNQYASTTRKGFNPSGKTRQVKAVILDGKKQCKSCGEWISTEKFRIYLEPRNGLEYFYSSCLDCERNNSKNRKIEK